MELIDFLKTLLCGGHGVAEAIAILPVIMAAMAGISAVAGGAASSSQNRKNNSLVDARNDELIKEQYQGVLDDPGSKAYLRTLKENLRDSIDGIENTAVSTGATHENVIAAKESANRAISESMASLLQREDQKRNNVMQQRTGLLGTQLGLNAQNAQNWAQVAGNVASAASMLGSAYLDENAKLFGNNGQAGTLKPENIAPDIIGNPGDTLLPYNYA